jgi:hypothetical protein
VVLRYVTGELVYAITIWIKSFYTHTSSSIRRQWIRCLVARRRKPLSATVNLRRAVSRRKLNHLTQLVSEGVQLLIQQLKLPARLRRFYAPSAQVEGEAVQLLVSLKPRR